MSRLTTNKSVDEMSMLELAYNSCYAKDGKAMYRDYDTDIDARELAEYLYKKYAEIEPSPTAPDELFDDWMLDDLQKGMDSIEGVLALLYRNLWAMADMRERLKAYEDKEEQGLLIELPVRIGEVIYSVECGEIVTDSLYSVNKDNKGLWAINQYGGIIGRFGNTVFATRSEAEEALAKMGGK